jgi:pyruvate dehydrogenase E1 component
VTSEVWSVTSFSELAREARERERANRLHPARDAEASHVARHLSGDAPIIAATDYVRAYPQLIASYVDAPFIALGTDGFGRSDTRSALRRYFEVDRRHVAVAALHALARRGAVAHDVVAEALARYGIDQDSPAPWSH